MEQFIIQDNILKGTEKKFELESEFNIGKVFLHTLSSEPHHVAQIHADTGRKNTFAEMKDRSIRCALWLKQQGIGSGDIITLCTHNHEDTYIPLLATFYVGATFNAWDQNIALQPARYLTNTLKPKVIFASDQAISVISQAVKLENTDTIVVGFGQQSNFHSLKDIMQRQSENDVRTYVPRDVSPNDVATIMLSSGSTGFPKGVMHSYRSALINSLNFGTPALEKSTHALCYSSPYWVTGMSYILRIIYYKAVMIVHEQFDVDKTSQVIEKYKVQRLFASPTILTYLCKTNATKKYDLSSLKMVSFGGSKMNLSVLQEFKNSLPNASVAQAYGMTEFGRCVTCQTPYPKSSTSIGIITPNSQMKIVDINTEKALGPNKNGEIYIKSPWIMIGYYKKPQVTKEVIDEEGWIHTGDIGYYDENGEFFIVDRIKEVMKFRGHHISPSEIEEVLLTHPGVMEAGVVSIPNDLDGDRPIAFVKKTKDSKVTEEELIEMSSVLGENKKLWGGVKFLEELPKTGSGKLMRETLKEIARSLGQN